jgi:hypothetical protein
VQNKIPSIIFRSSCSLDRDIRASVALGVSVSRELALSVLAEQDVEDEDSKQAAAVAAVECLFVSFVNYERCVGWKTIKGENCGPVTPLLMQIDSSWSSNMPTLVDPVCKFVKKAAS